MTNWLCILVYTPFLLITTILLFSTLAGSQRSVFGRNYTFFYSVLFGAQVTSILYYFFPFPRVSEFLTGLTLAFVTLIPISISFAIAAFYRLDRLVPKWLPNVLFIIPAITVILSITSPLHTMLIKGFSFVSAFPLIETTVVYASWFISSAAYCQILLAIVIVIVLIYYRNLPRAYRRGSVFIFLGLLLTCIGTFLEYNLFLHSPINLLLPASCAAGGMFYCATIVHGRTDYLSIKQRDIFNYIDEGILILDHHGKIVDANQAASDLLLLMGGDAKAQPFYDFLEERCAKGKVSRKLLEEGIGEDIYIMQEPFPLVYEMRSQPLLDADSQLTGRYIILSDVTNTRFFMERLREMAGVDSLLGIPNRTRYQELLHELDTMANLPLSVIMGDVNELKKINDTYGHFQGDILLQEAAAILLKHCPDGGYVARIGGDEFAMLLPKCSHQESLQSIDLIRNDLPISAASGKPISIAFGSTTKTKLRQNLRALINEADLIMYDNKNEHYAPREEESIE